MTTKTVRMQVQDDRLERIAQTGRRRTRREPPSPLGSLLDIASPAEPRGYRQSGYRIMVADRLAALNGLSLDAHPDCRYARDERATVRTGAP